MLPDKGDAEMLINEVNVQSLGISLLGFKDYFDGGGEEEAGTVPIASCFELKLMGLEGEADEDCEDPISSRGKAKNIRVYSAFGLCSANYSIIDGEVGFDATRGFGTSSCLNQ